jgi:ABC-2 type transport system permease protein
MRGALVQARLAYRATYFWQGWQAFVANVILRAPLTLATYAFVARSALDDAQTRFAIVGMILYSIPTTIIGGITQMFSNDREMGGLALTLVAARGRTQLYALRAVWHLPNALVAVTAGLVFSRLVLDLFVGDASWGALVMCAAAVTVSVAAFALLAGNLALVLRDYVAPMTLASGLILVCSGAVIPSDRLPAAIEWVANALPVTHGLRGFRAAFDGAPVGSVASDVIWELLVGVGYLVVGSAAFAAITERGRRTGSLELTEA